MIGPDTVGIAYCDGMVYAEVMDEIQPVPGHCIWLTEGASRDGTELLLDTKTGEWWLITYNFACLLACSLLVC